MGTHSVRKTLHASCKFFTREYAAIIEWALLLNFYLGYFANVVPTKSDSDVIL